MHETLGARSGGRRRSPPGKLHVADMPDDRDTTNDDAILAVPGILFVGAPASGRSGVRVGPAAGWMIPRGIAQWERELSFVARAGMTPGLASSLRATLARDQIAPKRFPMAKRAAETSPLLTLAGNLVEDVRAQGVRVHTVGVDRVSGDFYYFEEGGGRDAVRVQGNLVEMLSPSIGSSSTNAELAVALDGLIDRLLLSLSGGAVSELAVELADALPRLSRDGTGLIGTDLEAFEAQSSALAARAARWEAAARGIPQALDDAARKGIRSTQVPLFGEARREDRPALDVLIGDKSVSLPGPPLWTVTGTPREAAKAPRTPVPSRPSPTPMPARSAQSPLSPRPLQSPLPARPSPSPAPARPSPSPAPARAVAVGAEGSKGVKPTPLRFTPIPPRPEPIVAPAPAPAPVSDRQQANDPAPAPASAPEPAPASAPEPAPASESAPESAPASARQPAPVSAREPAPPPRAPAAKSSSTLVLALIALVALAYVAFERFVH